MPFLRRTTRFAVALLAASLGSIAAHQADRDAADAAKLIDVLEIRPGSTVADVGAGSGALVPAISRHLGSAGRLYATDINAERVSDIKKLATSASLQQRHGARRRGGADESDGGLLRRDLHASGLPPCWRPGRHEHEPAAILEARRPAGDSRLRSHLEGQRSARQAQRRRFAWRDARDRD